MESIEKARNSGIRPLKFETLQQKNKALYSTLRGTKDNQSPMNIPIQFPYNHHKADHISSSIYRTTCNVAPILADITFNNLGRDI
ncbi:MAG: hypothetical protein WAM42_09565 [Candidatus Nitrosopolaris sp.]